MLRRVFLKLRQVFKNSMAAIQEAKTGEKRAAVGVEGDASKKHKGETSEPRSDRKRKVALLIAYNGKGYYGLQINRGFPTIEGAVIKALLQVGVIPQEHYDHPQKMSFQRAARTDKGVSAAGNLISLKMLLNVENMLDKVNEVLPPQIRMFDCVRTTNGFNSKNHCCGRTYIYLIPTYAFAPVEEACTLEYRTKLEIVERINEVIEKYVGTHNFHNFTSGIKPTEQAANRHIRFFECRMPFVHNGVEFCILSVQGQSFMLHQIRKMIGLTISIVKGYANIEAIDEAWKHEKMDIPKAPGLGLMLDKLHYDQYNRKWASDGSHQKIDFKHLKEKLEKFKEEYIYSEIMKEEIETQSMMKWLATLYLHSCDTTPMWAERKRLRQRLTESGETSNKEIDEVSQDNTQTDCAETAAQSCAETAAQSTSPNQTDGTRPETNSTNQNESCDELTSSKLDCDSTNVDRKEYCDENNTDQSPDETKMVAKSSD